MAEGKCGSRRATAPMRAAGRILTPFNLQAYAELCLSAILQGLVPAGPTGVPFGIVHRPCNWRLVSSMQQLHSYRAALDTGPAMPQRWAPVMVYRAASAPVAPSVFPVSHRALCASLPPFLSKSCLICVVGRAWAIVNRNASFCLFSVCYCRPEWTAVDSLSILSRW